MLQLHFRLRSLRSCRAFWKPKMANGQLRIQLHYLHFLSSVIVFTLATCHSSVPVLRMSVAVVNLLIVPRNLHKRKILGNLLQLQPGVQGYFHDGTERILLCSWEPSGLQTNLSSWESLPRAPVLPVVDKFVAAWGPFRIEEPFCHWFGRAFRLKTCSFFATRVVASIVSLGNLLENLAHFEHCIWELDFPWQSIPSILTKSILNQSMGLLRNFKSFSMGILTPFRGTPADSSLH